MNEELLESDFDFCKKHQSEKSVKGSVREKIKVRPYMVELFNNQLLEQKDFKWGKNQCAFATSDNKCTVGFTITGRPQSLLKSNELDLTKAKNVNLIFRKTAIYFA